MHQRSEGLHNKSRSSLCFWGRFSSIFSLLTLTNSTKILMKYYRFQFQDVVLRKMRTFIHTIDLLTFPQKISNSSARFPSPKNCSQFSLTMSNRCLLKRYACHLHSILFKKCALNPNTKRAQTHEMVAHCPTTLYPSITSRGPST